MDIRLSLRLVSEGCSGRGVIRLGTCKSLVFPRAPFWDLFMFLLYINDLPDVAVHSTARLFADDCIVYRPIRNNDDTILLQNDLKGHCIEFKYYADGIHSGLTPPGNNS